ncbi:MAG: prepilin-type N-terminal cleavage/methylation domain-containing protein [Nitrospirota bacterium]
MFRASRPTGAGIDCGAVVSPPPAGGFTLIEIMVSLAILGASFIVLLGLRNRDIAIASEANHIVTGTLLARQKVADFAIAKDRSALAKKGDFGKEYPSYQWEMSAEKSGLPQLDILLVTAHWMEQDRREEVSISTYFITEEK